MTVTRAPGDRPSLAAASASSAAAPSASDPLHIRDLCPYLASETRDWRSPSPQREHRCTAVEPAALPTFEKQRRLCLSADHVDCATYAAASGDDEAPTDRTRAPATRWAFAATAAVLLDHGRLPQAGRRLRVERRLGQIALGGLMAVALGAVLVARLPGLSAMAPPPSSEPSTAPSTAAADVSPSPLPTPSATATLTPPPTPAPTPTPAAATYTVRSGDTLYAIALRHGTTVKAIRDLNGIDGSLLRIGQELLIPLP